MKVLVVEDDQSRIDVFMVLFKNDNVFYARTADRALKLLDAHQDWDLVMLDHDLEEAHYNPFMKADLSTTGRVVAEAIVARRLDPFVIVHSWNPDGAKAMVNILKDGGIQVWRYMFGKDLGSLVVKVRRRVILRDLSRIGQELGEYE